MLTEHALQVLIVSYLRWVLPDDQMVVGISNNPRSKATGGKEKARGMVAGFPDLLICGRIVGFLEVKLPGKGLRPVQTSWAEFCYATGMNHAVVHSIEEVRAALRAWHIKSRDVTSDLSSEERKAG